MSRKMSSRLLTPHARWSGCQKKSGVKPSLVTCPTAWQTQTPPPPPDGCWALLDFSNTFNSIDHGSVFEEIRAHIPSMAAWVEGCFGTQPIKKLGESTPRMVPPPPRLQSNPSANRRGYHGGRPGLKINIWYLDDGDFLRLSQPTSLAGQTLYHTLHL